MSHIFATPALNNAAARHQQIVVRQFCREVVELLNQQNRHVAATGKLGDHLTYLLDNRRLNALRRLIENQQLRATRQRTTNRQLLLLTAREIAAASLFHLFQYREQRVDLFRYRFGFTRRKTRQPQQQVFFDRESREYFAALWHIRDTRLYPLVRLTMGDILLLPGHRSATCRDQPHQTLQQGGFTHAVAPQQAGHFTRPGVKGDAAQNMAATVVLIQFIHL